MSDHTVINKGKTPLKVIDRMRGVHNVVPGAAITVDLQAVYCDGDANYSVTAVAPVERHRVAHAYHSRMRNGTCTDCGQPKSEHR